MDINFKELKVVSFEEKRHCKFCCKFKNDFYVFNCRIICTDCAFVVNNFNQDNPEKRFEFDEEIICVQRYSESIILKKSKVFNISKDCINENLLIKDCFYPHEKDLILKRVNEFLS